MKKLLEEEVIFHSTSTTIRLIEMPKQDPTIQTVRIEDGCQRTGWSDPTFPTDYDVMVEEKRRREEELDHERGLERVDFCSPFKKENLDIQMVDPKPVHASTKSSLAFCMRTELEQEVNALSLKIMF